MKFSLFNRYSVMTEEAVDHGMLGAHYESLRSAHDQLLPYPMIPADTISASRLRLFIRTVRSVIIRSTAALCRWCPQRSARRTGGHSGGELHGAAVDGAARWRQGRPA